mgnify:CR=1 FL=1
MLERQLRLEQADEAGARFEMADVGLGRADGQRIGAALAQRLAQRPGLDRVAGACAGAMRLDEGELGGIDVEALVDVVEQRALLIARGQRHAGRSPVGVDPRARDHAQNAVVVGDRGLQRAQHEDHRPLGADVAVAVGVERLAEADLREHRRGREAHEGERRQQHVHRTDDGGVHEPRLHGDERLVQRVEARGAGGVDGVAGPVEVEDVADPVRDQRQGVPGHELGIDPRRIVVEAVGVVGRGRADEHAGRRLGQVRGAQAGFLQRLPRHLKHQALLGVHLLGFARRNAEEARIEVEGGVELASGKGVAAARAARRIAPAVGRPTGRIDLSDGTASVLEERPEPVCVRSAGEPAAVPDDGDLARLG